MKMVFIDETSDSKYKNYFGLCCAVIDSFYYSQLKKQFHKILLKSGWNTDIEFKGATLFSATAGDVTVNIEKRIEIANALLDLNTAVVNARMHFHYLAKDSVSHRDDYLLFLPEILSKAISSAPKGPGKDIIAVQCDNRSDIKVEEIRKVLMPIINRRKYTLFEDIVTPSSRFETVGILYADLIGYLIARIDTISSDLELFNNIPEDQLQNNGKVKKLNSSRKLLEQIKELRRYRVKISKQ